MVLAALASLLVALVAPPKASHARSESESADYAVVGDAIPAALTGVPGNAARGRAILTSRQVGLCLLCHSGPFPEERFQGDLGPDLSGVGKRLSEGQLRLRLVDSRRLNPASLMPSYFGAGELTRVGSAWRSQPVLTAQQIEDVLALLLTLRD